MRKPGSPRCGYFKRLWSHPPKKVGGKSTVRVTFGTKSEATSTPPARPGTRRL